MGNRILLTLLLMIATHSAFASPTPGQKELDTDAYIEKLDNISLLPNLLPLILSNKDFIGLTNAQVESLEHWREQNREPLLEVMKQAAQKRIAIREAALSPTVSSARLQQMQNDIFRLQREILEYKLSCRDQVVRTFNNENWESFFMVLAGEDIGVSVPASFAEK